MKNYNANPIKDLMRGAKSALIVVPQISVDSIGSALALALSLKKNNLDARVYCPQKPDKNYEKLSGLELVSDVFSANDLVVSLEYPLDQIEQVSYNDDGGKLNLVVKTKSGSPKIEDKQIVVNNQSAGFDIGFMLGDDSSLPNSSELVSKGNWVFISPTNIPKSWAKATLVDADAPFCEIFTFMLPMIGLNLDADIAKDLLIGLRVATQSFSVNVSPETFEAGAICLRATQQVNQVPKVNTTPIEGVENKSGGNQPNQPSSLPTA